jgi:drug/metabolite transporter (DMT)-like permease
MLFLLSAVFIWGFSFALSKLALNTLSPFELVTARMFLGALTGWLITGVLRARRGGHDPQLENHGWAGLEVLILGLFEFAGTYILYTWAPEIEKT